MKICIELYSQQNRNYCFKIIFACICFLFIGAVYFIPDLCADRFHTPVLLWTGCLLSILGIIISIWEYRGIVLYIPVFLIVLYLCWGVGWLFTSSLNYYSVSLFFIDNMMLLLLYYYFLHYQYYLPFCFLLVILAGSLSLVAFLQLFGIWQSYSSVFVITGTFDNPAGISAILVTLLPFTFYFFSVKSKLQRRLSVLICVMVVIIILLSNARAAILAMVVVFGYFFKRKFLFICCIGLLLVLLYLLKPDSANGRFVIWRCCVQAIIDNPLSGTGEFNVWYMLNQAKFFVAHPNEIWAILLSDNIHHPFNEYLKVMVERGLIGLVPIIGIMVYSVSNYCRHITPEKKCAYWSLVAIAICSLFSYPFEYEIIKIVFISSFFILVIHPFISDNNRIVKVKVGRWGIFLLSSFLFVNVFYQGFYDILWTNLLKCGNSCDAKMESEYDKLYQNSFLGQQSAFLYNYGVVLYQAGKYKRSNDILLECSKKMNDYDVQLLQGYNYLEMKDLPRAEKFFNVASNMIPCRLVPLYELFRIYVSTGNDNLALETAQHIINMPVKIVSTKTNFIKKRVNNYLEQAKKGGAL